MTDESRRVAARVVVTGLVQGVFFRDSCHREAQSHNVVGWVRNNADGSVEAVFEGARGDVDAMVAWMRDGPSHARVSAVAVTPQQVADRQDFHVR